VLILLFATLVYFGGFWRCLKGRKLKAFWAFLLALAIVAVCSVLTFNFPAADWMLLQNGGPPLA
jgi:hypothetical protein